VHVVYFDCGFKWLVFYSFQFTHLLTFCFRPLRRRLTAAVRHGIRQPVGHGSRGYIVSAASVFSVISRLKSSAYLNNPWPWENKKKNVKSPHNNRKFIKYLYKIPVLTFSENFMCLRSFVLELQQFLKSILCKNRLFCNILCLAFLNNHVEYPNFEYLSMDCGLKSNASI